MAMQGLLEASNSARVKCVVSRLFYSNIWKRKSCLETVKIQTNFEIALETNARSKILPTYHAKNSPRGNQNHERAKITRKSNSQGRIYR